MRKMVLVMFGSFVSLFSFSQKTEIGVTVGSGLFFYAGASAVSHQNVSTGDGPVFIRNIPGKKSAFSQMAGLEIKNSSKTNWLTGFSFQAQRLVSKWMIDSIIHYSDVAPPTIRKVTGASINEEYFIALHPYAGKRFVAKKFSVDVTGGLEVALCLINIHRASIFNLKEKANSNRYDLRPNLSAAVNYKRYSVTLGYAYGLVNYFPRNINYYPRINGFGEPQPKAYSRFIKFSFGYRIK